MQAPNFSHFRSYFQASLEKFFLVPANTFDNVKGQFPIGFFIWNLQKQQTFTSGIGDVYNKNGEYLFKKRVGIDTNFQSINDWIVTTRQRSSKFYLGYMYATSSDFQHNNMNYIVNSKKQIPNPIGMDITEQNLLEISIYYSMRHCIEATWLNDRDQFLYPKNGWQTDPYFQSNCFTYTLFAISNNIQFNFGTNHWIPFTEHEVNAQSRFESHFMTDFIAGKLASQTTSNSNTLLSEHSFIPTEPLVFSAEASAVFDAGRELWRYYHAQPGANPNASYYDIREHFQGRNEKGKMNPKSIDETYNLLLATLKEAMEALRLQIVPKVYEYGFLIS